MGTSTLSIAELIAAHFLCIMCLLCAIYSTYFNRMWYKIKERFILKLNIATTTFVLACIFASLFNFLIIKSVVLLVVGIVFGVVFAYLSRKNILDLHNSFESYKDSKMKSCI